MIKIEITYESSGSIIPAQTKEYSFSDSASARKFVALERKEENVVSVRRIDKAADHEG